MAKIVKLGFVREREVLSEAVAAFGGRPSASVTGGTVALSSRLLFTGAETKQLGESSALAAMLNKVLTNLGNRFIEAIRKRIVQKDTIRTRLFLTGWKQVRYKDKATFNNAIRFTNAAPYALYVHPKGTPKSRTIVNVDIRGDLLPRYVAELTEDIERLRPRIAQAIALKALADAKRAARGRR
jgi:hypothetical protein